MYISLADLNDSHQGKGGGKNETQGTPRAVWTFWTQTIIWIVDSDNVGNYLHMHPWINTTV